MNRNSISVVLSLPPKVVLGKGQADDSERGLVLLPAPGTTTTKVMFWKATYRMNGCGHVKVNLFSVHSQFLQSVTIVEVVQLGLRPRYPMPSEAKGEDEGA